MANTLLWSHIEADTIGIHLILDQSKRMFELQLSTVSSIVHAVAPDRLYEPIGQGEQVVAAAAALYVPAVQLEHTKPPVHTRPAPQPAPQLLELETFK